MKKSLLSIFFVLCAIALTTAQYSAAQYIKAGNKALDQGKYFSSLINFSKAIELGEDSPELIYLYGRSAYETKSYGLAESAFEEYANSDEGVDSGEALYYLAELKHIQGKYEDAQKYYDLFLAEYSDLDPALTTNARNSKKSIAWAVEQNKKGGIEIEHLKREVNSDLADVSPVVFNDKLYYSTSRFTIKDKGKDYYGQIITQGGEPLTPTANFNPVEKNKLTGSPSFSNDGSLMVYSLCEKLEDESVVCKLFYTKKSGSDYGDGVALPESINVEGYSSSQPCLVEEGNGSYTLYYASNKPGGKGKYDIWSTTMNSEMDFSAPMALGSINTVGDDKTPYFHVPTKTLYFSSNGRNENFGDKDLYKSRMSGSEFGMVMNLGMPFNSSFDDRYFWLNEAGDEAYMVSNREGSYYSDDSYETCCYDIYRVDIAVECDLIVTATDCNSEIPISSGNVTIKDVVTGEIVYDGPLSEAGTAKATINRNNEYEVTVTSECYHSKSVIAGPYSDAEGDDCTQNVDICLEGKEAELEACTFDKKNGSNLVGSEICLLDVKAGEQECKQTAPGHCATFDIIIGKQYTLVGKKATYLDATETFHASCDDLKKKLYLPKPEPKCLDTLPLTLYFDNDYPDPGSVKETSSVNYIETCDKYYSKKQDYKRKYISRYGFKSTEREEAEADVESFFENELKKGCDELELLMKCLLDELKNGQNIGIEIRGFASPLASDSYNLTLSKRRIDSVKKALLEYQEGALNQYIENGQLTIAENPFGEEQAAEGVSDSVTDKSKSVYSPEAARERRVEIRRITNN